ncbi:MULTISPECIES: hypothetical protein [unclassified Rhizobium]|uniref:hypothetical protein n=1 Tax=unclassified Rhizobium TaxID=2613769 RepID=UPI0037F688C9
MISYQNQTFSMIKDPRADRVVADIQLDGCVIDNCLLSQHQSNGSRSVVRNVRISNSRFVGCQLGPARVEGVEIAKCTANDLVIAWGTIFSHVKLTGNIFSLKINTIVEFSAGAQAQSLYDRSREEFYRSTDWALDLSEARLASFDSAGIPGRLFRLDPETQGIVQRSKLDSGWEGRIPAGNPWLPWIYNMLSTTDKDVVLAAPLAKPKAQREKYLAGLQELKSLGFVGGTGA